MRRFKNFQISFLPPLLVYFAAGISGFTAIVEAFFVKENLSLSASFLASLAFWVALPWTFKMPLGHLVDLFWRWKAGFVYLGALLLAVSLTIMVGITGYPELMRVYLPLEIWYVIASLIAPIGFALQDVVADAMTVEAVPTIDPDGSPIPENRLQEMHVTMQTLGRVAIIGGSALVAGAGGWLTTILSYQKIFQLALILPLISISGVLLHSYLRRRLLKKPTIVSLGIDPSAKITINPLEKTKPNWEILGGSALLIILIIILGIYQLPAKEELIFLGTLGIIIFLVRRLLQDMDIKKRQEIVSIAIIIFVFRAMPNLGAGASWWQIDVLHFNEQFFGTLNQTAAILTIIGMLSLRNWIARHNIPYIVVFLSLLNGMLVLPIIGMYFGLHEWTQLHLGFGAQTIALIDIATASPFSQIAMIPMLAWIAENAPLNQKATYFAVFAAFMNLALSASSLFTKYMNNLFPIERGNYEKLGALMISVTIIGVILPTLAVINFKPKRSPNKLT